MQVDGTEVRVSGDLLQPLTRRTSDIVRVVAAVLFLVVVIIGSLVTRNEWNDLERSVSNIVGVLSPDQSNVVYLTYGVAILALPFTILAGLVAARRWKLLGGYVLAAILAGFSLSVSGDGVLSAPNWRINETTNLDTFLSQVLDDPRWIAIVAAVLTVSGPGLPARWARAWWTLLLAFVPIHLVISTVIPARSILGLSVGWLAGAIVVWIVGTPALEVPLAGAVRALARRGSVVTALTVLRPAGGGPLVLSGEVGPASPPVVVELFGPNQFSRGAIRQIRRRLTLRSTESAPLHTSQRRAVEHQALMAIAFAELSLASSAALTVAPLDRGWMMYAHTATLGRPLDPEDPTDAAAVWRTLGVLRSRRMSHGDLRADEIGIEDGTALLGGFAQAELGASDAQMNSDAAQALFTLAALYGPEVAVDTAVDRLGAAEVLTASRRVTPAAIPKRVRDGVPDAKALMTSVRDTVAERTGADAITAAQVTRFSRNQIVQLVLLIALVYVAYPFISQVPTFVTELGSANWWWAGLALLVSTATYLGAAMALWACASGLVSFWHTTVMQIANTFAATTTPAGVGGLALSVRFLQKSGLSVTRSTAAVALQQTVQVITHVSLLVLFSIVAGTSAQLSRFVPDPTILYLIAGVAFGVLGGLIFLPTVRRWLRTAVRPQLAEVSRDLVELARSPGRFAMIILGCATTTLGAALALWASVEAFGGGTTFVTVTVVTMIGGTLAAAAPTPGGVGAVEAALIGGLAAFGLPVAVAVPSVLLYRVVTCWLPVFCGWPILHWLGRKELI